MYKSIDKTNEFYNNVITLIKHFIKEEIKEKPKGGNDDVTAGNDKTGRNYV